MFQILTTLLLKSPLHNFKVLKPFLDSFKGNNFPSSLLNPLISSKALKLPYSIECKNYPRDLTLLALVMVIMVSLLVILNQPGPCALFVREGWRRFIPYKAHLNTSFSDQLAPLVFGFMLLGDRQLGGFGNVEVDGAGIGGSYKRPLHVQSKNILPNARQEAD